MRWRKWHAYVGLAAALPLILIAITGVILLFRSQFDSVQPSTMRFELENGKPLLSMEEVLSKFEEGTVDQVIYRPAKANYSVRLKNGNEVQLHPQTGIIGKDLPRRSGFLIDIHQGSWLGPFGQYVLHFAAGVSLIFLLFSGILIFPFRRWRKL